MLWKHFATQTYLLNNHGQTPEPCACFHCLLGVQNPSSARHVVHDLIILAPTIYTLIETIYISYRPKAEGPLFFIEEQSGFSLNMCGSCGIILS